MGEKVSIGLVSDTHGWLDPELHVAFEGVRHIIHAGDIGQESVLEELGEIAPVVAVRGNIDGGPLRFLPEDALLECQGVTIAALHIAGNPRRPNKAARELLTRTTPDVIVVGHSHIPVVGRVHKTLWINPGAAGRQGFHQERFAAILHIGEDGALSLDRVLLGPRSRPR